MFVKLVLQFLHTRELQLKKVPAPDLKKFETITRLRTNLSQYAHAKIERQCNAILGFENELRMLIPGEHSPFEWVRSDMLDLLVVLKQLKSTW